MGKEMTYLFRKKNETIFGTGNSPLAGGRVHYYIAGTTTRLDTYADQAGSTINDNPVILNADGDFPTNVYLGEVNDYKEVIETADSSSSTTIDNIPKAQAATTTLLVQSPSFVWTTVSALNTILDETQVGKAFAANTQNNNVTFLLPNPALSQNGPTLVFKKINASNSLILQDHLGGAFLTIDTDGDSVFLSSNGADWYVVSDLNSSQGGGGVNDDEVTNVKLANVASGTFKGRLTAGVGDPEDLSSVAATSLLDVFSPDNDVDTAGVKGLVPAPAIGDASAGKILSADGTWIDPPSGGGGGTNLNPATGNLVGVNATADTTNRLSVSAPATLFNHEGNGHQHKINKNTASDNASILFQTNFSGRAEFGLTGDDDFHMKVSPDGTTFHEGIVIDKDTGAVTFPNTTFSGGSVSSVFGRAGAVVATAGDYSFDEIGGVSQNVLIGRLTAGTGAQEALSASQVRSFLNVEDNAAADQTGSEIKTALFAEADTNNFDDAQQSKLASIETGATADQTGAEIKALYEAEANTNAFDDAAVSKLSAIEPLADVTDESNVIASLNGSTLSGVTVASDDKVIIQDLSDSDNIKTVTAQSIADLSSGNGGDVSGPSSSTDFRIATFDGSTGKVIKELDAGLSGQFLKTQGSGFTPVWESIPGGGDMLAANNLSDVSDINAARANLGVSSSTDTLMLAIRVADLEGDALGIVDGIADPFDDETDVDRNSSSNIIYSSTDNHYSPTMGVDEVPTMSGTSTAGVTITESSNNTSTTARKGWEAFDDNIGSTSQDIWVSSSIPAWVKVDFGGTTNISAYTITAGANSSHTAHSPEDFELQGSNDDTNWTTLDSQSSLSWGSLQKRTFTLSTSANYRYYRIHVSNSTSGSLVVISEIELMGGAENILLVSKEFTSDFIPTTARLIFFIKPIDPIAINTDVVGAVSRDNGVTYTDASMAEVATYSDGTKVYEAESTDISAQPSGTSMKWKLTTANSKSIQVTGALLQWS